MLLFSCVHEIFCNLYDILCAFLETDIRYVIDTK